MTEQHKLNAILAMQEMTIKVLWGQVVERGVGLNWRVHGVHTRYQGPIATIAALRQ